MERPQLNGIPKFSLVTKLREWGTFVAACAAVVLSLEGIVRTEAIQQNLAVQRARQAVINAEERSMLTALSPVPADRDNNPLAEMLTQLIAKLCPDDIHFEARRNPLGPATFEEMIGPQGSTQQREGVTWYEFSTQDGRGWLHSVTDSAVELSAQRNGLDSLAHQIVDPVIQEDKQSMTEATILPEQIAPVLRAAFARAQKIP